MPLKYPDHSDYEIETSDAGVVVTFKPTKSIYTFTRLAPEETEKHGPLSAGHKERHAGPSGDTGDYWPDRVRDLARSLAVEAAAREHRKA